jgi:flotillin
MFDFLNTGVVVVFGFVLILVLIVAYIGSRYKVAGANEALIRSGRAKPGEGAAEGLKVVRGGGLIVLPLFHKLGRLKLTARQINVALTDAVTSQGIKVALEGVATFKVGADEASIRNAAERFLETDIREVDDIVKNVLEGSLRSIVGTLTVEELNLDRQKFQQAVQSAAIGDLATSGLVIDSFTIQAIGGEALAYMELVGKQELARRERDARMAQATADQEAKVREAEAQKIKLDADRGVLLREADVKQETEAAQARAAQAGPLAQAKASQEVMREQTALAELEAERKAKELLTTTVRPAEAEAAAVVKRAEGDRAATIATAQAEAEQVRLHGEAEALIVRKKGEAEAATLEMRAEAYQHFNAAAILATVMKDLPGIVGAAAEPVGKIQNLTVLSTDGASEIVRTATGNLTQASTAIKGLTGIDIPAVFSSALQNAGLEDAAAAAPTPTPREPVALSSGAQADHPGGDLPTERAVAARTSQAIAGSAAMVSGVAEDVVAAADSMEAATQSLASAAGTVAGTADSVRQTTETVRADLGQAAGPRRPRRRSPAEGGELPPAGSTG